MRNAISTIFLGALIVFFFSCKNDGTIKDMSNAALIVGDWELRHEQIGMTPTKTYPSGDGNILKFSASSYERYNNGSLVKSGHYTVVRDPSVEEEVGLDLPAGKFANRIVFDSYFSAPKIFIEISNDSLTLLSGYFPTDGGSRSVYIRQ